MTTSHATKPLGIVDLLVLRGFDRTRPAKLVRHQDARYDVHDLMPILQILPKSFARSEVLEWEQRYKEKLGSRAAGLNVN